MFSNASTRFVVLAALDGSARDTRVAETAASMTQRFTDGELHFIYVVATDAEAVPAALARVQFDKGREILEAAARAVRPACTRPAHAHLTAGVPWKEVVRFGRDLEADLLIVGTHDRSAIGRLALGSVAQKIVSHASCPVLLMRPKQPSVTPEIEPPCADCVRTRAETGSARFWCTRHSEHHVQARLHYEVPPSFALGSMLLRT